MSTERQGFKTPAERQDLTYGGSMAGTERIDVPRLPKKGSIYKDSTPPGVDHIVLTNAAGYFCQQISAAAGQGGTGLTDYLKHMATMTEVFTPVTISKLKDFAFQAEASEYRPKEETVTLNKALDYVASLKVKIVPGKAEGMVSTVDQDGRHV